MARDYIPDNAQVSGGYRQPVMNVHRIVVIPVPTMVINSFFLNGRQLGSGLFKEVPPVEFIAFDDNSLLQTSGVEGIEFILIEPDGQFLSLVLPDDLLLFQVFLTVPGCVKSIVFQAGHLFQQVNGKFHGIDDQFPPLHASVVY